MKSTRAVSYFLTIIPFVFSCASVTPVAKDLTKSAGGQSIKIVSVNIGPNSIIRGKSTYTPKNPSEDFIHVTLEITNISSKNMNMDFTSIKLQKKDSAGKLSDSQINPAYYRFFPVSFSGDIADDAKTMTGNDPAKPVVLKPNEKMERTLIYLLDRTFKPGKIIFSNAKNLEFPL